MKLLNTLLCCALAAVAPASLHAQSAYPERPIRIVVPFPPGGSTDTLIRLLGPHLTQSLGQPVVVENKPGAAATLGADNVARAPADGYTLLAASAHHTIAQAVLPTLQYDIQKSFAPIGTVALIPNVVVVNAELPAKTIPELVALTRQQPDRYNYGSAGPGSAHHLIGEMFKLRTGAALTHVPYSGSAPAVTGLLSNQVQVMFDTIPSALPHIKSGRTRALAVTTGKRASALPDVPTLQEAGVKDVDIGTWFGLMAPAGTDPKIVARLNRVITETIALPAVRQQLLAQGIEPMSSTPQEMRDRLAGEVEAFRVLVQQTGMKAE